MYTLQWKIHCHCYTLPPVFSSGGYHSDGVVCVALEASEDGLICCWVTEVQGGLTTSLRTVGHTGGVEAVGSWAWTSPLPWYPDTWCIHEPSSDISGSSRSWRWCSVTNYNKLYKMHRDMCLPLAGRKTILGALVLLIWPPLAWTQMVYSVLHWRLGRVALLVAVVLPTVYIIREPSSGW